MIVSIRPVVVATGRGADLLGAVGGVPAADVQSFSHEQQMEFIVLEDGTSQPISVIQGNELQFRPGDRVVLTRDGRTRLRRAGV
jgi:outer membrane lipoprotein SlyB